MFTFVIKLLNAFFSALSNIFLKAYNKTNISFSLDDDSNKKESKVNHEKVNTTFTESQNSVKVLKGTLTDSEHHLAQELVNACVNMSLTSTRAIKYVDGLIPNEEYKAIRVAVKKTLTSTEYKKFVKEI